MLNTRWVKRRYKSYRQDETTNNRNPIICEKKKWNIRNAGPLNGLENEGLVSGFSDCV